MLNQTTLGALYKYLKNELQNISDAPDIEARRIIEHRLDFGWTDIIAVPENEIDEGKITFIEQDLQERLNHRPLSKIYGSQEFYGLDFKVNDHVLDPRPDTETIVDIAVRKFRKKHPKYIIDLGTGSGCLIIALLIKFPGAQGVAVDKSPEALEIAKENALSHEVLDRLTFIQSDWWDGIDQGESFDLIVSNPPYIRESVIPELSQEVQNHDPILALDGGEDGLQAYKKIFSKLNTYMNEGAVGLFEIGYDQKRDAVRLGEEAGFIVHNVHQDLAGNPRVVEISNGDK